MGFDGNAAAKSFGGGRRASARPCDNCRSATATVFCKADAAFLCLAYIAGVHGPNKLACRHKLAWMCQECERTPAAFACRAVAAALCVACDMVVHLPTPSPAATCESLQSPSSTRSLLPPGPLRLAPSLTS